MAGKGFTIPTIFTAYDKISGTVNTIRNKIATFASSSVNNMGRMFSKVGSWADNTFDKIVNIRNAIGIAFAGGALVSVFNMTAATAAYADELATTTQRIGISSKAYQELTYAAKLQNVEQETLTGSLEKLNKNVGDAQRGQGALFAALQKTNPALLRQIKNAKDTDTAFNLAIQTIEKQPNAMKKAAMAQTFFGKSGQSMLNLIADGSAGLAKLRTEADKYGNILTDDTIAAASKFDDAHDRMQFAIQGLKNKIGAELMPILQQYMDKILLWVQNNKELIKAKVSEWVQKIRTGLEWLIKHFDSIVKWVKIFIGLMIFLKVVSIVMQIINAGVAIYNGIIAVATALQWAWNAAMMANPMTLIVIAIIIAVGALIAIIAIVVSKVKGWGEQWDSILKFMKLATQTFVLAVKLHFLGLQHAFLTMVDAIVMAWKWGQNKIGALSDEQYKKDITAIRAQQAERVKAIKSTASEMVKTGIAAKDALQWKLEWDNSGNNTKQPVQEAPNTSAAKSNMIVNAMTAAQPQQNVKIDINNNNNSSVDVKSKGGTAPRIKSTPTLSGAF